MSSHAHPPAAKAEPHMEIAIIHGRPRDIGGIRNPELQRAVAVHLKVIDAS